MRQPSLSDKHAAPLYQCSQYTLMCVLPGSGRFSLISQPLRETFAEFHCGATAATAPRPTCRGARAGSLWLEVAPQSSHRSRRAHHTHLARHLMKWRPARSVVVAWTRLRSRRTWRVSLRQVMRRHPLPWGSPNSFATSRHLESKLLNLRAFQTRKTRYRMAHS